MIISLVALFISAFVAFSLSAICGGGAGLMLMPVLGIGLPVSQVPAALSIGTISSSVSRIFVFNSKIRWNIVQWFVPTALPAVFLGAWLLHFLNPLYLEIIMGLFLVSNITSFFKKVPASSERKSSHSILLVVGFLAGFLSGLTGAVGLLFNRFYLRYGLSKEEIVATRAANEIILHLIKLGLYASFGLLTYKVIAIGIVVAVAAILSSWSMKWGIKKISEVLFKKLGYASMVISGIFMLSQSVNLLFSQNNASLSFSPLSKGIESKLQWQNTNLALEFEYDEGLEYEQEIPLSDLSTDLQKLVMVEKAIDETVRIEEVFGFSHHSYEAYYFHEGKLRRKMDF
jgi:uncharacterized membrane protein YfcA